MSFVPQQPIHIDHIDGDERATALRELNSLVAEMNNSGNNEGSRMCRILVTRAECALTTGDTHALTTVKTEARTRLGDDEGVRFSAILDRIQ